SNLALVACWKEALKTNNVKPSYIDYLDYNREKTQSFLKDPDQAVDLIVPRGGERLIQFVKSVSKAPVLVSGRGNNFLYVHEEADWKKVIPIIINAKTDKISACNALDKVLIDERTKDLGSKLSLLINELELNRVDVLTDPVIQEKLSIKNESIHKEELWYEEFLSMKILIGLVKDKKEAIDKINTFSGKHSASILTENDEVAQHFMSDIDAAAVYHNVSTRFTDGGEFGLGAELAISTDKLHHRGPLGLEQLVSNKWFIKGNGQVK
ncbi:MAG: glutamate-5-semialdehyde dehydrogenase, partial [Bacteroidota bacterium]